MACCQCMKPRYKRLVDSIYPKVPGEKLVSANMAKLQYYALQNSPNKLDKIGEYLYVNIERDIARNRDDRVYVSMDCLDELLAACHSRALNLFATSFLSIIQTLLECNNKVDLQARATKSFVQFCNIQEESPAHHFRKYELFIHLFCVLCFTGPEDSKPPLRRVSGLQGLQGIVRKTLDEDVARFQLLTENNLNQMVPALLMNIERATQDSRAVADTVDTTQKPSGSQRVDRPGSESGPADETTKFIESGSPTLDHAGQPPAVLAERCLRDLFQKTSDTGAGSQNLARMFQPLLTHLDATKWSDDQFSSKCINLVFTSINSDHAFAAITFLLEHISTLDAAPEVKIAVVRQLKEAVNIAKPSNIGTLIYQVFDKILTYLKLSITHQIHETKLRKQSGESKAGKSDSLSRGEVHAKNYQTALIEVMGAILLNVEDVQKLVIFSFLFKKISSLGSVATYGSPAATRANASGGGASDSAAAVDKRMITIILKSIERVAQEYTTHNYCDTFKPSINEHLLMWSVHDEHEVRLLVQQILHRLTDRHGNTQHLKRMDIHGDLSHLKLPGIVVGGSNDQGAGAAAAHRHKSDMNFMKVSGQMFYQIIYECALKRNNTEDNYHSLYCTLCLLAIELGGSGAQETMVDIFKLLFALQDAVKTPKDQQTLSSDNQRSLTSLIVCVFHFMGKLHVYTHPNLDRYVSRVLVGVVKEGKDVVMASVEKNIRQELSPAKYKEPLPQPAKGSDGCLFSVTQVEASLAFDGVDKRIASFVPNKEMMITRRPSLDTSRFSRPSLADIRLDMDSDGSQASLAVGAGFCNEDYEINGIPQEVTVETIREILNGTNTIQRDREDEKNRQMADRYRSAPLKQIADEMAKKSREIRTDRTEIMKRIETMPARVPNTYAVPEQCLASSLKSEPVYEMTFPAGYLY